MSHCHCYVADEQMQLDNQELAEVSQTETYPTTELHVCDLHEPSNLLSLIHLAGAGGRRLNCKIQGLEGAWGWEITATSVISFS